MSRVSRLFIAAPLLLGIACELGSSTGRKQDAGQDSADASVAMDASEAKDAGSDARDAGSDAGQDASQDAGPLPEPTKSAGCGSANAPKSGAYSIDVEGTERTHVIDVPTNYDPNKAHRLIFAWHGNGGNGKDIADHGFYDMKPLAGPRATGAWASWHAHGWARA